MNTVVKANQNNRRKQNNMPLPKISTKAWTDEVDAYLKSDSNWRDKRAKQLGYNSRHVYQNMMERRGISLRNRECPPITDTPIKSDYPFYSGLTWDDHIRIMSEMHTLIDPHVKTPSTVNLDIDSKLPVAIVESSDWQLGQFGVDYQSFKKDMDIIETEPGLLVNIGGDGIQNIIQASKMGSSHNQDPIAVQKALYALTLKKLQAKILSIKSGNHLDWDAALSGEDWLGEKARQMKAVYIKNGGRLNYHVGKQVYPEWTIHKGRYNSSFNQTHSNKQYQRLHCPWARIITVEHHHVADIEQYRYDEKECVAIRPGTYAVYDDFARANGFFGSHVCNPTVILFPDRDKIIGFKDMHDAIPYLRTLRKGK
jgi:hypothetical protein